MGHKSGNVPSVPFSDRETHERGYPFFGPQPHGKMSQSPDLHVISNFPILPKRAICKCSAILSLPIRKETKSMYESPEDWDPMVHQNFLRILIEQRPFACLGPHLRYSKMCMIYVRFRFTLPSPLKQQVLKTTSSGSTNAAKICVG